MGLQQLIEKWGKELKDLKIAIQEESKNENRTMIELLYPKMQQVNNFVEDLKTVAPDRVAALKLLREYIIEIVKELPDREGKILEMRFGLIDSIAHTLEEVGKKFNVTRERIRQIEAKALEKIREMKGIDKIKDYY